MKGFIRRNHVIYVVLAFGVIAGVKFLFSKKATALEVLIRLED